MTNKLDTFFGALADPTRRAVIERLTAGPAPVSELPAPHDMALPTFMKHLSKLEAAGLGGKVAFEVDHLEESSREGTSVLVKGTARVVDDWAEQEQLEQLDIRPWQRQPWRRSWMRIDPTEITGRRLGIS